MGGKQQRMVFVSEERNSEVLLMRMGCRMLLVVLDTCRAYHKKYLQASGIVYIEMYSFLTVYELIQRHLKMCCPLLVWLILVVRLVQR